MTTTARPIIGFSTHSLSNSLLLSPTRRLSSFRRQSSSSPPLLSPLLRQTSTTRALYRFKKRHTITASYSSTTSSSSSSSSSDISENNNNNTPEYISLLHHHLTLLNINASSLSIASKNYALTGYDPHYGKSAIKTYNSYLKSQSSLMATDEKCAIRTARQIDFLIKRHKSHTTDWIRHTDTDTNEDDDVVTTHPLTLVLDNVRSAFNVGSIFRSADACHVREIITTGITPHPYGNGFDKLMKSSLGAERIVSHRHFDTTRSVVDALREEYGRDVMLVGMETTNKSECYWDVEYRENDGGTVLFLGNEVSGVDTEILELLDVIVEVPMFGRKNSLNVAASAPIVMYEVLRQWQREVDSDDS